MVRGPRVDNHWYIQSVDESICTPRNINVLIVTYVEIYRDQKFALLASASVKIIDFLIFCEVLIY